MLGSPPYRRPLRTALVATVAAALLGSVSGCSGGDGSDDTATDASSATPTATGSATPSATTTQAADTSGQARSTPEKPRRPPAKDTVGSRVAFARYVMASWSYALATNDASAVTSLSAKGSPCQGCKDLTAELGKRSKQKWFVDFPGVHVDKVRMQPDPVTPGAYVARAKVDIPASRSYFEDGSYRNDNDAHPNTDFLVRMRLAGGKYTLLAFEVG